MRILLRVQAVLMKTDRSERIAKALGQLTAELRRPAQKSSWTRLSAVPMHARDDWPAAADARRSHLRAGAPPAGVSQPVGPATQHAASDRVISAGQISERSKPAAAQSELPIEGPAADRRYPHDTVGCDLQRGGPHAETLRSGTSDRVVEPGTVRREPCPNLFLAYALGHQGRFWERHLARIPSSRSPAGRAGPSCKKAVDAKNSGTWTSLTSHPAKNQGHPFRRECCRGLAVLLPPLLTIVIFLGGLTP